MVVSKPKLSYLQQIDKLNELGIYISEDEVPQAIAVLRDSNYYFKIASFRKNFQKVNGKYNITFEHLRDLAILDMRLRYVLLNYCLDIEHSIKTFLLRIITNNENEDGYDIVKQVIDSQSDPEKFKNSLFKTVRFENDGVITFKSGFEKYYDNPPIWVILEISPIGKIKYFVEYLCKQRPNNDDLKQILQCFTYFNSIRNAAAHNKPLIFNMREYGNVKREVFSMAANDGVTKVIISLRRNAEIYSVLKIHNALCSEGMRKHRQKGMQEFLDRFESKKELYKDNSDINLLITGIKLFVDIFKV